MPMVQNVTYYTYILKCSDGSYYTGKTTDLKKRLRQHNGEIKGGAKYTRVRRPVMLTYIEKHSSHPEACKREAEIKLLTHIQKATLNTKHIVGV